MTQKEEHEMTSRYILIMSKHLPEVMICFIIKSLDFQLARFRMLRNVL